MINHPMFGYEMLFAGQKAQHAFKLYHYIGMTLHHNRQVKSIVELGTARGAMSIYLGLWGARLNIPVHTFDHDKYTFSAEHNIDGDGQRIFDKLSITKHTMDYFSDAGVALVMSIIGSSPTYLYCDGGNKPMEFFKFVPMIPINSVVSAHDWPGEIVPADIDRAVKAHNLNLQPWEPDNWQPLALGTWIKR